MPEIKTYKGKYTGKQIDEMLSKIPQIEEKVNGIGNGGEDKHFEQQFYNATSYTVTHHMGKKPAVEVCNESGNLIVCDVIFNDGAVTVNFGKPQTGTIILN